MRRQLILVATMLLAAGWIQAQESAVGSRIRLQQSDSPGWSEGTFQGRTSDSLIIKLQPGDRIETVAVPDVVRLQQVRGSHWGTGLLIGAALGATIGVVGILTSCAEEDVGCANTNPGAAVYGLGGAVVGGLIGLGIGAVLPNWEETDPALLVRGTGAGIVVAVRIP